MGSRVSILSPEHEVFVQSVFEQHRPGSYLTGRSAEERIRAYFKMDKGEWRGLFMHDCLVAFLRRDGNALNELKNTYRQLAKMLGWPEEEPWLSVENAPAEVAKVAAEALFNLYRRRLRAEGWRVRGDEALFEGLKRGLDAAEGAQGDAFRTEFGRWFSLGGVLHKYEREVRLSDRVALWLSCELEVKARLYLYGDTLRSCYIDHVLQGILSGGFDSRLEEALWEVHLAAWAYEENRRYWKCGSLLCETPLILAMVHLEGFKPKFEPRWADAYLQGLEKRLGKPGLAQLFSEAIRGTGASYSALFKAYSDLTDEELNSLVKEREASEKFFAAAAEILGDMLKKYGYREPFTKLEYKALS